MAVDCGDKENLPPVPAAAPAPAPAVAVARLHGVAAKKCRLKRFGKARRRVPLRDITNLVVVGSVVAEWQALRQPQERAEVEVAKAEPAKEATAVQKGLAGGAATKAGRYSLRKEFR